jgi:hypothetical protein
VVVSGNHTYAAAGAFAITCTIDHENVFTTAQSPAAVVNLGITVQPKLMGNIGFWQNSPGQALIESFGLAASGLTLGQWLATIFPNLYGGGNGASDLRGCLQKALHRGFYAGVSLLNISLIIAT